MLLLPVLSAFASSPAPADVALVPGCPANDDGTLSHCQARRVAWVARLWDEGAVSHVITSGSAVYNPYVEADVMADALVALGIPADRVLRERDAMHTDENVAWSLHIAESRGFDDMIVATDMGQAQQACTLVRAWSDIRCTAAAVDYPAIGAIFLDGFVVPARPSATPVHGWLPLPEREARIAATTGQPPRRSSIAVYLRDALRGVRAVPPALPPVALRTPVVAAR